MSNKKIMTDEIIAYYSHNYRVSHIFLTGMASLTLTTVSTCMNLQST